ncbi:fungal-specific actin related protein [Athelia psychrophila]|uniref:Fungal-specific actin related protein n=1 Tax=Athelia psychrophila TaxID=1759441 RepID=A0A166MAR1_9AGAM|nr:fungal-specific actin related protein [Fibularhizoctonia sp. CBS 109695]
MSGPPATPRAKAQLNPTTPTMSRTANSHVVQASPHYATSRRHSLYGTEDRVIIDPGSRVWKVGFSGEGRPRDVFYAVKSGKSLWDLSRAKDMVERAEQDRLLEVNLEQCLRSVFHHSLLTDPKSRKVILVEHPLLPLYVKEMLARVLFNNLQIPSISFASSHLLSLLAVGRITGLVLDCGHLESTALPIFASRPLFPHLRTTPLAGSRLASHLRSLLLLFGTYLPPPTSLSAAANIPASNRSTRVPEEVLTDAVIEEIKTRCCFVSDALDLLSSEMRAASPSDSMDMEVPPSDSATSESEFSRASVGADSAVSSDFSVISYPNTPSGAQPQSENPLQALASMYTRHSTATELRIGVMPPASQQAGTGRGTLVIPGWIRERAAEVLFEGGDVDESSVAEIVLDALIKIPVDLRKTLASSILVVGGTSMLPGFIPRLHAELLRALAPPSSPPRQAIRPDKPVTPLYDRYACLRHLTPYFAILNNPAPPPARSARADANAGKAPAFSPATLAWIGGSLAGSLKTGGVEVPREKWDEADPAQNEDIDTPPMSAGSLDRAPRNVLPDWTRTALPLGASPAVILTASPQSIGA